MNLGRVLFCLVRVGPVFQPEFSIRSPGEIILFYFTVNHGVGSLREVFWFIRFDTPSLVGISVGIF